MTGPRADQRRASHHGALDAIGHCRLLPDVPAGGGVLRVYSRSGYRRAMCSSEQLPQHPRPIAGALDAGAVIPGAVNVRLRQGSSQHQLAHPKRRARPPHAGWTLTTQDP